ncbi:MAG TPA: hypothetical protein VH558_04160 [Pseudolabrys sp.]
MPKKSSQWSVPAVLYAASLLLSGAAYAQSGANAALCKEFNIKVNQCMSRAITIDSAEESGEGGGHSSQAEAFRNCYNVYCRGAIIAGCSISDTCKYGLPPGRTEVHCKVGEHLIFHGAGKPAECQKNAQGSGSPLPSNKSTITDRTSQGKPACPDHFFRAADTGECVYCDAIWVNGKCIYD